MVVIWQSSVCGASGRILALSTADGCVKSQTELSLRQGQIQMRPQGERPADHEHTLQPMYSIRAPCQRRHGPQVGHIVGQKKSEQAVSYRGAESAPDIIQGTLSSTTTDTARRGPDRCRATGTLIHDLTAPKHEEHTTLIQDGTGRGDHYYNGRQQKSGVSSWHCDVEGQYTKQGCGRNIGVVVCTRLRIASLSARLRCMISWYIQLEKPRESFLLPLVHDKRCFALSK
jgi:hypothetical protein